MPGLHTTHAHAAPTVCCLPFASTVVHAFPRTWFNTLPLPHARAPRLVPFTRHPITFTVRITLICYGAVARCVTLRLPALQIGALPFSYVVRVAGVARVAVLLRCPLITRSSVGLPTPPHAALRLHTYTPHTADYCAFGLVGCSMDCWTRALRIWLFYVLPPLRFTRVGCGLPRLPRSAPSLTLCVAGLYRCAFTYAHVRFWFIYLRVQTRFTSPRGRRFGSRAVALPCQVLPCRYALVTGFMDSVPAALHYAPVPALPWFFGFCATVHTCPFTVLPRAAWFAGSAWLIAVLHAVYSVVPCPVAATGSAHPSSLPVAALPALRVLPCGLRPRGSLPPPHLCRTRTRFNTLPPAQLLDAAGCRVCYAVPSCLDYALPGLPRCAGLPRRPVPSCLAALPATRLACA